MKKENRKGKLSPMIVKRFRKINGRLYTLFDRFDALCTYCRKPSIVYASDYAIHCHRSYCKKRAERFAKKMRRTFFSYSQKKLMKAERKEYEFHKQQKQKQL